MKAADRREIPDPFVARHRVVGAIALLLGLVVVGVLLGLVLGELAARIVELVLRMVGGGS
ncbi:hypothetical protein [Nocardioides sp.]|uniref:hypothetical protein n=1 Tax=Nocardioides sp. TaxID=35761 RepID=UPI0037847751